MRPEEIKQKIKRLGLSEKLLLIEDVWDSIALENNVLPISEWQKNELDARYNSYKDGKQNLHDWASVHENLRQKFK